MDGDDQGVQDNLRHGNHKTEPKGDFLNTSLRMSHVSFQGIWKFFSNLFSGDRPGESPYLNMAFPGEEEQVGAALTSMRSRSNVERRGRGGVDLFDGDTM